MFAFAVRIEYQAGEGPAWIGFTINDAPGDTEAEALAWQAEKFNSVLSRGGAITLTEPGQARVIPAHSVLQLTVRPEASGA
jgi:hypothetical protein